MIDDTDGRRTTGAAGVAAAVCGALSMPLSFLHADAPPAGAGMD